MDEKILRKIESELLHRSEVIRYSEKSQTYALRIIKLMNYHHSDIPAKLRKNREFVLEAVKQRGIFLRYTEDFKNDKEIVLSAIKEYPFSIDYASDELKKDKDIILELIKTSAHFINLANLEFDKQFILQALKINRNIYNHLSTDLKNNEEIYLEYNKIRNLQKGKTALLNDINFYFSHKY